MRMLITGVTGFVGCHLAQALLRTGGWRLHGVAHQQRWLLEDPELASQVPLRTLDLCETVALVDVLQEAQPDRIIHLAGYADVSASFKDPEATWRGNLRATRSLYEAVSRWGGKPRILFIGTGAVYGESREGGQPLSENTPMRPINPYATSKAAADLLSYQYVRTHGLDVLRARPFNHVGPGQSPRFALASFAWQIAAIEAGLQAPTMRVGNLWAERDFTDVRDVVQAYVALLEKGETGEAYNVATGDTRPMQTFLDHLLRLSKTTVQIETDPGLVRKVETSAVHVDVSRLKRTTGWQPRYTLEQTLEDTLDYCRAHVNSPNSPFKSST